MFVKDKFKELKTIDNLSRDIKDTIVDFSIKSNKPKSSILFNEIQGLDYVKDELKEIIDFLKNPSKYKKFNIKLPKGILLVGPPGVGKTMMARSLANHIDIPFYYQSGSSFASIYVGSGSKKVKEIFNQAKKNAPCIIFIDEMDAIGKARGNNRNDERETTLNELLTQMDGFENSDGVIIMGATNKIDMLDDALLRAGRFDKRIFVNLPNLAQREDIIKFHISKIPNDVNISIIAKLTAGVSSAGIATYINEASLSALNKNAKKLTIDDFYATKDKVFLGKKLQQILTKKDKTIVSTYKASQVISLHIFSKDISRISMIENINYPDDELISSDSQLLEKINLHLSGSAGLSIILNDKFSYSKNDINKAKEIANQMVYDYGMGESYIGCEEDINKILIKQTINIQKKLLPYKDLIIKISDSLIKEEELSSDKLHNMINDFL
jgi:ATP-dependent metalloprotease FtsH